MERPDGSAYSAFLETSARYLGLRDHVGDEAPGARQPLTVPPDPHATRATSPGGRA